MSLIKEYDVEYGEIREQVLDTVRKLCTAGLVRLSAGNVSARHESGLIAITPTSVPYDIMEPEDIVIIAPDGRVIDGRHRPSSETPMHTAVFAAMPEVGAVVHTHSIYAMAFSVVGRNVPVVTIEGIFLGGEVPVASYAAPGSVNAGEVVLKALSSTPGLKAVLQRNHGLVAIGKDLNEAWENAYKAEIQAQVFHLALQIGEPITYSAEQISQIFSVYQVH